MKIVAFDPGKTTGYAVALVQQDRVFVAYGQSQFTHLELLTLLTDIRPDLIVCESFEFRRGAAKDGVELSAPEFIGIVKLYRNYTSTEIVFQPAHVQGPKAYWSDAKLKEEGLYDSSYRHGRSAVKHLLYWYSFRQDTREDGNEIALNAELVDMDWLLTLMKGQDA